MTEGLNKRINFTGYDARRISTLIMSANFGKVPKELAIVGEKVGFKVKVASGNVFYDPLQVSQFSNNRTMSCWAQDIAVVMPDKKNIITQKSYSSFAELLSKSMNFISTLKFSDDFQGGNMFFIKNSRGNNDILIGKSSIDDSNSKVLKKLGVERIHVIPQMDFHIDLAVRPLDKKRIFVADDDMTEQVLINGIKSINKYLKECNTSFPKSIRYRLILLRLKDALKSFRRAVKLNKMATTQETVSILKENGFNPIKVPGRLYNVDCLRDLRHEINYMNSIVLKDTLGKLVYITNKSQFDSKVGITPKIAKEIGFSFESSFIDVVSQYIPRENIYFIKGENNLIAQYLQEYMGGIHCLVSEIPL